MKTGLRNTEVIFNSEVMHGKRWILSLKQQETRMDCVGIKVEADNKDVFPLLALPLDVVQRILYYTDARTLGRLAETNSLMREEVSDDRVWREQTIRRFRVTPRTKVSRRLQAAGGISWRTLYTQWHTQPRMPISRFTGPTFNAFAKGCSASSCGWMTVHSSDDCKLPDSTLRVRVVVQNVYARDLIVEHESLAFFVSNVGLIVAGAPPTNDCSARVVDSTVHRARGSRDIANLLRKDDFVVHSVQLRVHSAVFEIDALERLTHISIPVVADGKPDNVICKISERQIWDSYELLPGGWWARIA